MATARNRGRSAAAGKRAAKKAASGAKPVAAKKAKPGPALAALPVPTPATEAKGAVAKVAKGNKATAKPAKADAKKKAKRIRGEFAMPAADHARIARLKDTARRAGVKVKKNELLRLGLRALQMLPSAELQERILALRLPEVRAKG